MSFIKNYVRLFGIGNHTLNHIVFRHFDRICADVTYAINT